jgi:hypothetical protein
MSKRLLHALKVFALLVSGIATLTAGHPKTRIELKDGWYVLNGHKTLINAIGYESGARPGEAPYDSRHRDLAQIRSDLKVIKAAGFNGIRTWSQMSEAELKVVQASGLKVIFGIWLKPDEDFADPAVVARDLDLIHRTLAYTRNYDCILTYLIMNEPMPEHIRKVGAQATRDLWTKSVNLIHQLHPGVPVTISGNSAITEWLDLNLFDVYGRNAYDYKEGANFTHGYAQAQRALTDSYGQGKPALLTEFGRSVSRHGGSLYGGNTLQEQAEAMTKYYRDLLDAGVTGFCPFYYADGWWKAGAPTVHNDEAEEWFGFFGFKDLKDAVGLPRPAWHALKQYNQALIASPKNQQFYQGEVPIEMFCQSTVKKVRVVYLDGVRLEAKPDARGYLSAKLSFAGEELKDRELVFESYDAKGQLLKVEVIVVLTGKDPIQWPTLELRTEAGPLEPAKPIGIELKLKNNTVFQVDEDLRIAFSHHKGWDRADTRTRRLDPTQKEQSLTDTYQVPANCPVLAIYAGTDIRFGKFRKTIGTQTYLYPDTWADPLRVK